MKNKRKWWYTPLVLQVLVFLMRSGILKLMHEEGIECKLNITLYICIAQIYTYVYVIDDGYPSNFQKE